MKNSRKNQGVGLEIKDKPLLEAKLNRLLSWLRKRRKLLVAYSGGVDSSFLLQMALKTLGPERVVAVTGVSPLYPVEEIQAAKELARKLKASHLTVKTQAWRSPLFLANRPNRCYLCKKDLYRHLNHLAKKLKLNAIADGTTQDDLSDFRPGEKARRELGVAAPLKEAGLTKREIRALARKFSLPVWNKPASPCLASRVPYGCRISLKRLRRIHQAENALQNLKIRIARVRDHYPLARIEIEKADWMKIWRHREEIVNRLKAVGYVYVTVDLEGFRSGSLNAIVKNWKEQ
ncbi:MAG: ATP-dependent sacrificial sulfur transferase LarE [Candidatus Omnitrophica bacterium]|nr:ATP-dependent sacrificial sulfur transferase LarE [Candidatus Omnitrophota bacterium]MCM8769204.1 ATP-dependent sacrificial sulfur transferase LarE [Candidatus Omnitrophota bacterium]